MKYLLFAFFAAAAGFSRAQPAYTMVFLNSKPDAAALDSAALARLMQGHLANMERLAQEKKLLAAGPFEGGGGLFILGTGSEDEAIDWLHTDPAVQAGRWNLDILPLTFRKGSVCPVGETYEMTSYTMVRFHVLIEKYTAASYPALLRQHESFLDKKAAALPVVADAVFGDRDGGFLIINGEASAALFSDDPAVQQGLVSVTIKKLYIARGSFCE